MIFPIRDENPQLKIPVVTYCLIALNILAWLVLQGFGTEPALSKSVCAFGLIPADLSGLNIQNTVGMCNIDGEPNWITSVTSMFMHGSWMHIFGNMWFLWIFGNNVEDAMGSLRFAVFYLLTGLIAAGAQIFADAGSVIPMVGASGAIGGVMGAYIVLYPRVHVHMLLFLLVYVRTFAIPAIAMLGYWFLIQLIGGISSIGSKEGGVAFWAHIGGFAAGMVLVFVFKNAQLLQHHPYRGWHQKDHPDSAWKAVANEKRRWQ